MAYQTGESTNTTTSRSPNIAWQNGFERYWCQDSPAITHAFNAFSFLLPKAEIFFIIAALDAAKMVDFENMPELKKSISAFVLQESRHSHQHQQYNNVLYQQGFRNVIENYIVRYQNFARQHFSPLANLAIVCAYEHFTAIIGDFVLSNPVLLQSSHPDLALIWGWHCVEELTHKAVCFDLYRAIGGGWIKRVIIFILVSINFAMMFGFAYIHLLYQDGCLKLSRISHTLSEGANFFFSRQGIFWCLIGYGMLYFKPKFYPSNANNQTKVKEWLSNNQTKLKVTADHHEGNAYFERQ